MRTTVDIDDKLYREAKILAASRGVHLRELFEEGLRRVVQGPRPEAGTRVNFPLIRSKQPGSLTPELLKAAEEAAMTEEDRINAGLA